jgi:4-amino-4-deoxy-L-arabinose transferase-like glycosyltransferase
MPAAEGSDPSTLLARGQTPNRPQERLLLGLVLALTSALYASGLDVAPFYIGGDEAQFAGHAHSIATTARDLNGTRLPLFVRISDPLVPNNSTQIWYQPVLFYAMALGFKAFPVAEWSVRLPTVLIGILDVFLVYAIGRRILPSGYYALLAALMLALTPAHFLMCRQALDYVCPLPFVLGWLWCLVTFNRTGRPWVMLAAGLILGLGVFSHISSWMVMPMLLAVTLATLWPSRQTIRTPGIFVCAGFVIPLLSVVPGMWAHPEALADTMSRYRLEDGRTLTLLERAGLAGGFDLGQRVSLYWDYFNPSFLFFSGGANPTQATQRAGVFLLASGVFMAFGLYAIWRRRSTIPLVLLLIFAAAPAPIVLTLPPAPGYSVARAMTLVPFGILIAGFGVVFLLEHQRRAVRVAAVLLLLSMPLQFAYFARDYFTDYQVRAASRFDPIGVRELVDQVAALDNATRVPGVFLNHDLDDKSVRWLFYLLKIGRMDLWDRTGVFIAEAFDPRTVPPNSLLVLYANDPHLPRLLASGACSMVMTVAGVSGTPSAAILRRNP